MNSHPKFTLAGVLMKQHLASAQTGGSFSLFENRSNGPSRTPIHVHAWDDETLYIMDGEMRAVIAGEEQTIKAGESIFLPRGIPHQLMNDGVLPAHYLLLCTPGGFEGFLADGGHALAPGEIPGPPSTADLERLKAAAPRYGITLLPSGRQRTGMPRKQKKTAPETCLFEATWLRFPRANTPHQL